MTWCKATKAPEPLGGIWQLNLNSLQCILGFSFVDYLVSNGHFIAVWNRRCDHHSSWPNGTRLQSEWVRSQRDLWDDQWFTTSILSVTFPQTIMACLGMRNVSQNFWESQNRPGRSIWFPSVIPRRRLDSSETWRPVWVSLQVGRTKKFRFFDSWHTGSHLWICSWMRGSSPGARCKNSLQTLPFWWDPRLIAASSTLHFPE
jgi:hypothetical protein